MWVNIEQNPESFALEPQIFTAEHPWCIHHDSFHYYLHQDYHRLTYSIYFELYNIPYVLKCFPKYISFYNPSWIYVFMYDIFHLSRQFFLLLPVKMEA